MTQEELYKAKNPDLITSFEAMKRAAALARKIAIQTNTSIVIVKESEVVHVSAEELRLKNEA